MLTVFLFVGSVEPHLPPEAVQALQVAHLMTLSALFYLWCRADAAARAVPAPAAAPLLVALLPLFGVPYYFFRTRPWRGALRGCARALGFLIGANILSSACFALSAGLS